MPKKLRLKDTLIFTKSNQEWRFNKFKVETPALVSKAQSITKAIELIDGLKSLKKGHSVLVKPNINSDDLYPGTSRPEGLKELLKLLLKKGLKVTVGDMSSVAWSQTSECSRIVGLRQVCDELSVPFKCFKESGWVNVSLPDTSLRHGWFTEEVLKHDHLINLAVLKTHCMADFTLSLKNLMGCIHLRTRLRMHASLLNQRIAEFNKVLTPTLNLLDGTKCFIDGGPDKGEERAPGVILASRDRVALDVTGVELLKELGSESLSNIDPWVHPQIKTAVKLGLGVGSFKDIKLVE